MKVITTVQWINLFCKRIRIVDTITFFVRKVGPIHIAELGLTAGRQADKIQVNLEIFKSHCTLKKFTEKTDGL